MQAEFPDVDLSVVPLGNFDVFLPELAGRIAESMRDPSTAPGVVGECRRPNAAPNMGRRSMIRAPRNPSARGLCCGHAQCRMWHAHAHISVERVHGPSRRIARRAARARARARSRASGRRASARSRRTADQICASESGSTSAIAASASSVPSPAWPRSTSRCGGMSDATTGQPHAIASASGKPKPSSRERYTSATAPRYSAASAASSTARAGAHVQLDAGREPRVERVGLARAGADAGARAPSRRTLAGSSPPTSTRCGATGGRAAPAACGRAVVARGGERAERIVQSHRVLVAVARADEQHVLGAAAVRARGGGRGRRASAASLGRRGGIAAAVATKRRRGRRRCARR